MGKHFELKTWIVQVILFLSAVVSLFTEDVVARWYLLPFILIYLFFAPGIVLLQLIGYELKVNLKWLVYTVCLSVLFLFLAGLFINYSVPSISNTIAPLGGSSLRVRIFSIFMPLWILGSVRVWKKAYFISETRITRSSFALWLFFSLLPVLAVTGAFQVNRSDTNVVTIGFLVIVVVSMVLLAIWRRLEAWYGYAIWMVALALLWMLSFRSALPVGWDIAEEMAVFTRTQEFGRWMPVVFNPAYNACLSITIFPTILSVYLPFTNSALFKILFPFVFSLVSICGYEIGKRVFGSKVALVGIFYMMAQPLFIQPMVGLGRQMIAMAFFGALLMNLFSKESNTYPSKILNYLLVTGMVLAHYSTSYIAIFLMAITYFVTLIYKNTYLDHDVLRTFYHWLRLKSEFAFSQRVSFSLVLYSIVLTVFWYSQVNQSSTGVLTIVGDTIQSLSDIFVEEIEGEEAQKAVTVFSENRSDEKLSAVNDYVQANERFFDNTDTKETLQNYIVTYLPERGVPGIMQGTVSRYVVRGFELVKTVMKFMVPLGSVLLVWLMFRRTKSFKEFIIMAVIANLLITVILFHPTLGRFYNVTRLSMQNLIFLALIAVYGVFVLCRWFPEYLQRSIAVGLVVLVFCLNYGLVYVLTGGYPFLHLYNYGDDYNKFYYSQGEMYGAEWLQRYQGHNVPIFTDTIGNLRLMMGGQIRGLPSLVPSVVYDRSYVYQRKLSVEENRYSTAFGYSFSYTFSPQFLDLNKNLVYSNPESKIYR